jgi:hypothetical protein
MGNLNTDLESLRDRVQMATSLMKEGTSTREIQRVLKIHFGQGISSNRMAGIRQSISRTKPPAGEAPIAPVIPFKQVEAGLGPMMLTTVRLVIAMIIFCVGVSLGAIFF